MDIVTKTVTLDEMPESWREGLGDADQFVVTIKPAPRADDELTFEQKKKRAIESAAGIWADRDDLDELFADQRRRRREKMERLFPES